MLLYQRSNGGWPQYKGDPTDYRLPISAEHRAQLLADKDRGDATLDDRSTTTEIRHLLESYVRTANPAYFRAAEAGLEYLLAAQYPNGGWPQRYPDTSGYHGHITFNDGAMINVLRTLRDAATGAPYFTPLSDSLRQRAETAVAAGINCILLSQVYQDDRLTSWGAQHDRHTLAPAPARKFEPAALSGKESVGILLFLMEIPDPSSRIQTAIREAVAWFESVRIDGYRAEIIEDPEQPTGRDRVLIPDADNTVWARFYELKTNRPLFTGRDGVVRYRLEDVDNERRVGYGFYGEWGEKLLEKAYPRWEAKQ